MRKLIFKESFQIIYNNWKSYLWSNIIVYGAFAAGLLCAWLYPAIRIKMLIGISGGFQTGSLSLAYELYYLHRNVPLAIVATFLGNLFKGTFLYISLPSFIIPLTGFLMAISMNFFWGLSYGIESIINYPPVIGVVILEAQGYVLAVFGAYLHASRFLTPTKFNIPSRKVAYITGLKMVGKLYILIIVVLMTAACYEVILSETSVIFPNFSYSNEQLGFSGANVKLKYTGSYVFYDSLLVMENDAKAAGVMFESIQYLKPGDPNAIRLCKVDSCREIQFYLDEKYWNDKKINQIFRYTKMRINKLYAGKCYRLKAFCSTLSGIKKGKYFAE